MRQGFKLRRSCSGRLGWISGHHDLSSHNLLIGNGVDICTNNRLLLAMRTTTSEEKLATRRLALAHQVTRWAVAASTVKIFRHPLFVPNMMTFIVHVIVQLDQKHLLFQLEEHHTSRHTSSQYLTVRSFVRNIMVFLRCISCCFSSWHDGESSSNVPVLSEKRKGILQVSNEEGLA